MNVDYALRNRSALIESDVI